MHEGKRVHIRQLAVALIGSPLLHRQAVLSKVKCTNASTVRSFLLGQCLPGTLQSALLNGFNTEAYNITGFPIKVSALEHDHAMNANPIHCMDFKFKGVSKECLITLAHMISVHTSLPDLKQREKKTPTQPAVPLPEPTSQQSIAPHNGSHKLPKVASMFPGASTFPSCSACGLRFDQPWCCQPDAVSENNLMLSVKPQSRRITALTPRKNNN